MRRTFAARSTSPGRKSRLPGTGQVLLVLVGAGGTPSEEQDARG